MEFCNDALHVENDFRNILGNTGDCGKLVLNAVDFDGRNRGALKRRKKNPSQRVAESYSVTSFKRLNDEFTVSAVFAAI